MDWINRAGRIMCMGDSITVGYTSLLGGWRPGLSSALTAAGISHEFAGVYVDAYTRHHAASGTAASQQTSALQTDCEAYDPATIIIGWGANDVGGNADGGQQHSAATALADIGDVIDWCVAGAPQAFRLRRIFVQTLIVPQNATLATYYSRRQHSEQVNVGLVDLCDSKGVRLIDVGAPATSDGLHPSQAGYATMAATISAAVISAVST